MASRRWATVAVVLATVAGAAGCGDDDDDAPTTGSTNAEPTVAVTAETQETDTTATVAPPADEAPNSPEDQPGGAGDEEANVVPVVLQLDGNAVQPDEYRVPAFFTIRITGRSRDGEPHTIEFQGEAFDVAPSGEASMDVEGLPEGNYPVTIDGTEGAVTIITGAEAGP